MIELIGLLRRAARKPPAYVLRRAVQEFRMRAARYAAPRRLDSLTSERLANLHGHANVDAWWDAVTTRAFPTNLTNVGREIDALCPGDRDRVIATAESAYRNSVTLLGSGPLALGERIDWQRDYKSGVTWPHGYCRDLEYGRPRGRGDVKFPWELSRMQWLIPVGQAYLLTGDERYAGKTADVIRAWIDDNPYAGSINWACTMEVALRIVTWTWFVHAFRDSATWAANGIRGLLLREIYLHADFTARHLEESDVNGNHYTANAMGLVFAGLFFGESTASRKWLELGWEILCDELPKQVYEDGVDYEGSVPYHRLVQELFLLPALYRRVLGFEVPEFYQRRLVAMARFTAAYSRPDGSSPLVGDADDARVLPFGGQDINDHRYLLGIVGSAFDDTDLRRAFSGPRAEIYWVLGADAARVLEKRPDPEGETRSVAFPQGGYFVLRNNVDHVFVNCAPLGLGGRGGHGHNDILSFEATLDGVHLISDCGAYLYTASYAERNLFRSTAYHNTPRVDDEEINRFIHPDYLWVLSNDAKPQVRRVLFSAVEDRLVLGHTGYHRLASPVTPVRTLTLCHTEHRLCLVDDFEGSGDHTVEIPLHFAPGVEIRNIAAGAVTLAKSGKVFSLAWRSGADWVMSAEQGRVSPSYGICHTTTVLKWRCEGKLASLEIEIFPLQRFDRGQSQLESQRRW